MSISGSRPRPEPKVRPLPVQDSVDREIEDLIRGLNDEELLLSFDPKRIAADAEPEQAPKLAHRPLPLEASARRDFTSAASEAEDAINKAEAELNRTLADAEREFGSQFGAEICQLDPQGARNAGAATGHSARASPACRASRAAPKRDLTGAARTGRQGCTCRKATGEQGRGAVRAGPVATRSTGPPGRGSRRCRPPPPRPSGGPCRSGSPAVQAPHRARRCR